MEYETEFKNDLDHYLEIISAEYHEDNELLLEKIVVNADTKINGGWDDYGNSYQPEILFFIPKQLYLNIRRNKTKYESKLQSDIQSKLLYSDQYIKRIIISMTPSKGDWREKTGALLSDSKMVAPSVEKRIWGDTPLRVFFSYTKNNSDLVINVKNEMDERGIFCFVAEKDIPSSLSWADEIENALSSTQVFVSFLTDDYSESEWTDQEIGFAECRSIPIISINLGQKPYGFASRYQALPKCDTSELSTKLFSELIKYCDDKTDELITAGIIARLKNASSYNKANNAANDLYRSCRKLSEKQVDDIIDSYNSNTQIRDAIEINRIDESTGKQRLVAYLESVTGKEYHIHYGILSIKE